MPECRFPQHHSSGGSGFPWAVLVIVVGAVLLGSSAAFARIVHDLLVAVVVVVSVVAAGGLTALGLVLRHRYRMETWVPPVGGPHVVLHLDARMNRRDEAIGTTGPRAVEAPHVVTGKVVRRPERPEAAEFARRVPRGELGRKGGR